MTADHKEDDRTRTHVSLIRGTVVSHYWIAKKIGAGRIGEVYLPEGTNLARPTASLTSATTRASGRCWKSMTRSMKYNMGQYDA